MQINLMYSVELSEKCSVISLFNVLLHFKINIMTYERTEYSDQPRYLVPFEPRCEKTCLWGFRPVPTQTGLYNHRRWLEA